MADIYRAKEAFAFDGKNGVPRVISAGDLMSSDDSDFKGKEHLFEPVADTVAAQTARRAGKVEDASAEPNARRSVSTTHKTTAAKGVDK